MTYEVQIEGTLYRVELTREPGGLRCRLNGREVALDAVFPERDILSLLVEGRSFEVKRECAASELHLVLAEERFLAEVREPRAYRGRRMATGAHDGPRQLLAPMPGKVMRVLAGENERVEAGQGILVIEAMKMQNELKTPKAGIVRKLLVKEGAAVNAGDVLAIVE
ncbi:MAG: acetyl-CoA carboxylase biotin carboxyl carrier protein subunit [Terriglobales bacterium]